jgi:hypothetical protein
MSKRVGQKPVTAEITERTARPRPTALGRAGGAGQGEKTKGKTPRSPQPELPEQAGCSDVKR